jgi:hypothetical protein
MEIDQNEAWRGVDRDSVVGPGSVIRIIGSIVLGALTMGAAAHADEAALTVPLSPEQAQARQLGIFLGGAATSYDLCVRKGFLPKDTQVAEEVAKSILEKMRALSRGPDQSVYVQDGWDMMKKEVSENESFYTREKCAFVGKEWAKIIAQTKKQ